LGDPGGNVPGWHEPQPELRKSLAMNGAPSRVKS
jgi:hypothetical protein